jgi:hypothetical protein
MLWVMRLDDRQRSGTGWLRGSVSFRRAMPLMVVDGAAGDRKGEHEFRDVVGGKVMSGFSFGRDLWRERLRRHKTIVRQSLLAILPGEGLSTPGKH